jgi:uncharacterized protein YdbL (DUF1318 family)
MKRILIGLCAGSVSVVVLAGVGCARVRVEAPKDPIKVDVTMRLDIYQHIEKDIDDIESLVNDQAQKQKAGVAGPQSLLQMILPEAYAQEGLGSEVEEAARRRGSRKGMVEALLSQGVLGENASGLLDIRATERADAVAQEMVTAENADRVIIYKAIAKKNGSTLAEVEKLYAQKLQALAPAGSPVETGKGWEIKK